MTVTLAEGLVIKVRDYFTANMATRLTALNAEYADTIVLTNPETYKLGRKSLRSIPEKCVGFVYAPTQRLTGSTQAGTRVFVTLNTGVFVVDQDSETLDRRLYRYGRAIHELLIAGETANAWPGWVMPTDEPWTIDTEAAEPEGTDSDYLGLVVVQVPKAYAWEA